MKEERILYKNFGKFMGQTAPRGSNNYIDIIKRAKQNGLRTRFLKVSDPHDDIGSHIKRLNVIAYDDTKRIAEITIG